MSPRKQLSHIITVFSDTTVSRKSSNSGVGCSGDDSHHACHADYKIHKLTKLNWCFLEISNMVYGNYPAFCNITQSQNGRFGTLNMDEHGRSLLSLWQLDGLLLCRLGLQQPCGLYTLWNKPVWLAHQHHHHHSIFEVNNSLLQSENTKRRYTRTCCCWRPPYLLQVNPRKLLRNHNLQSTSIQ